MGQRKIRHHYVPVSHLRHFAGSDGLIWIHDRLGRFPPRQDTPKNIAYEKFLYAPGIGADDPNSDTFEDWLAQQIDGPAAEPIRRIVETGRIELTTAERSALSAYVATQDLRTPKVRDSLMAEFQQGLMQEWPGVVRGALEALGEDASPGHVEDVMAQYEVSVNKSVWLDFLGDHVNKAGQRLYRMAWCLIAAPSDYPFVLNDLGVIKLVGGFNRFVPHRPGWYPPITHWLVPLSATIALGLSPHACPAHGTATPHGMRALYRRTALDARESVFAPVRLDIITSAWREEAAAGAP